jgi:putative two-component system response regulator
VLNHSEILQANILIVDDLEANVLVLTRMLESAGYTTITSTMDPVSVSGLHLKNRYDLILLDLRMPGMDGFQVIEELKGFEPEGYPPVLVITAQPDHKLRALQVGAKDFISKPFELAEVLARVHNMLEVRLLHKELREANEALEGRVRKRTADLQESYLDTILTLSRAAEFKDEGTGAHVRRISRFCLHLARVLELDAAFADAIYVASPMHDIGKIGIPDHILLKPGPFTPEEWVIMREHPLIGSKILGSNSSPYLRMGAVIALNHHERWDGSGYPNGISGEAIPLAARIMHICDVYDALRSKRPYKPAFTHRKAMDIMTRGDDRTQPGHFDPALLEAFSKEHLSFADIFESYAT